MQLNLCLFFYTKHVTNQVTVILLYKLGFHNKFQKVMYYFLNVLATNN